MLTEGLFAVSDCGPLQFCGPTAIAALTGLPIVKVEDAVLAYRAIAGTPRRTRKPRGCRVHTMWGTETVPVLQRLGYRAQLVVNPQYHHERRTFPRVIREVQAHHGNAPLLVLYTGHFVAVRGEMFVDTMQRTPVAWSRLLRVRRKRVVRVWKLEEI